MGCGASSTAPAAKYATEEIVEETLFPLVFQRKSDLGVLCGRVASDDDEPGQSQGMASKRASEASPTPAQASGEVTRDGTSSIAMADSVAAASGAEPVAAEAWQDFELGAALGHCIAWAPSDTRIGHPMIMSAAFGALTMAEADELCLEDLEAAVADFVDTYDGVSAVTRQVLSDGYLFTAENEADIGGTNYWLKCRRTIQDKAYAIEATAATAEQRTHAVAFARSVRAPTSSPDTRGV